LVQEEEHFFLFCFRLQFSPFLIFSIHFPPHPYRIPHNTTCVEGKERKKRKVVLMFSVASSSSSSSFSVLFLVLHFCFVFFGVAV